jgi:suppressor of ftsI
MTVVRVASVGLLALTLVIPRSDARAQRTSRPSGDTTGMSGMPMDTAHERRATPMAMSGMTGAPMTMPIPMPAGMPMMPGLVGLAPAVASFLPGAGVNPATLPLVQPRSVVRLRDRDTLDLTAMLVRRMIHGRAFAMYGFNGQVPGPLIRVPQNATIIVRFKNRIDLPSAVHWHGVRLDNHSDGVPGLTQDTVPAGGSFTYRVHFPDAGLYWYHPHVREDIEQAMGLFGNMIVDSPDTNYYAPANREQILMLDDLLTNADTLIPFGAAGPDFTLMGRVGNTLLVNDETKYTLAAANGEVVRFYLTNVSSSRTYNLSFGGASMKIVASDESRFEHEERVHSIVIAPAERYIVDVRFAQPGRYALINAVQAINHFRGEFSPEVDTLGVVTVDATPAAPDYGA